MRIDTSGKRAWRTELYEETAERLGERTKSGGVDAACEFSRRMLHNLERAVDHPDMTPELAELLSTPRVQLEYRVETSVQLDE